MENTSVHIAQTILNQIKFLDKSALMAWGAKNYVALPEPKNFQGGVRFQVNGLTFKGWVKVELTWLDEYQVSFINKKAGVGKSYEGVYCDMLVDIIEYIKGKYEAA